jgi:uncharacterized protein (DUF2342 family)
MAKDKAYVAAAVGTAEVETPEETTSPAPEAIPAVAPAPSEVTTEETPVLEPAAALEERLVTITFASPVFVSPQAKRVLNQYAGLRNLVSSIRTSIHEMLSAENESGGINSGQHMFFTAMSQGTYDIQGMCDAVQGVLTGTVNVDNEGEPV